MYTLHDKTASQLIYTVPSAENVTPVSSLSHLPSFNGYDSHADLPPILYGGGYHWVMWSPQNIFWNKLRAPDHYSVDTMQQVDLFIFENSILLWLCGVSQGIEVSFAFITSIHVVDNTLSIFIEVNGILSALTKNLHIELHFKGGVSSEIFPPGDPLFSTAQAIQRQHRLYKENHSSRRSSPASSMGEHWLYGGGDDEMEESFDEEGDGAYYNNDEWGDFDGTDMYYNDSEGAGMEMEFEEDNWHHRKRGIGAEDCLETKRSKRHL